MLNKGFNNNIMIILLLYLENLDSRGDIAKW